MRRIWRITTIQRDERSVMQLTWFALAIGSLAILGVFLMILKHKAEPLILLRVLAGIGAGWFGMVWAMLFLPASILLNSPANARLVPRQRRRLMQMAAGGWLLTVAGISFVSGEWAAIPAFGISMIAYALMRAGKNAATPLFLIAINWGSLSRYVLPDIVVRALSSHAGLLVITALLLPGGLWALRSLYPAGGDKHMAGRGEQVKRANWFERHGAVNAAESSRLSWWATTRMYRTALRQVLRRPQPGAMLMHALGPVVHWSAWSVSMAGMLLVSAALRFLLVWRGDGALQGFINGAMGGGLAAMSAMIMFSTAAFSQQLRKTTGEQALLRLTPLAGNAALLNRRLAVAMLEAALRNWVMLTIVILLSTMLLGGSGKILVRQVAICVLAGQLATLGLLGDFAGHGGWNLPRGVLAVLLGIAEFGAAFLLSRLGAGSIWTWLALIALVIGALQLRYSWRKMLAAPPAFPAGRMA